MRNAVPDGWQYLKVGNAIDSSDGGVSVNSENRVKSCKEFGILKTSSVVDGRFYPQEHKAIFNHELERASTNPKKDHILFSRMNTPILVGQSGFVDRDYDDLFLPDRLWQLKVNECYSPKWLSYTLRSQIVVKHITDAATGTSNTMKNIAKPNLMAIPMLCPPLPEQRKIAAILSSVDDVIEKTQAQINKLKDLKVGMMQELLTKGIGHTEFKDSPVGRIPVGWEVVRLGEIYTKIIVGYVGSVNEYYCDKEDGVPFYRTLNIRDGYIRNEPVKYVTTTFNDKNKKSQIFNEDILIARVGANLGMTCKVTGVIGTANIANAIIIKSVKTASSDFYMEYIRSDFGQRQINSGAAGGAQGVFNTKLAQELIVPVPPVKEQTDIADKLLSLDVVINRNEKKLSHQKMLKKALMQDLLTGKVRVTVD